MRKATKKTVYKKFRVSVYAESHGTEEADYVVLARNEYEGFFVVACVNRRCKNITHTKEYMDKEVAIKFWNKRSKVCK